MQNDFNNTSFNFEQDQTADSRHDSLLGCLLFESFCGGALEELFAEATDMPQWARSLNVDPAIDIYEEYRQDRANGGFKLGVSGALNGMFNRLGISFGEPAPALYTAARGQGSYVTAPALSMQ